MEVEVALEALALFGMRLPHHIVIYFGIGGNSKGARSNLRAKVFGSLHKWVSPGVFDKSVKEAFRIQGAEFHGASFCTLREADGFELDEKNFRSWTAGEPLACRLPYAVHTPMLSWEKTAKFWEMNLAKTPNIPSVSERSFQRRIIGIEKSCTFVDGQEEDAASKVFKSDPNLEDMPDSGDAVWCYLRLYLFPWLLKHDAQQAKRLITQQSPDLRKQTDKLLRILTENQGVVQSNGNNIPAATFPPTCFDPSSPTFQALVQSHQKWDRHQCVKAYMVNRADWLLGSTGQHRGKHETRLDLFMQKLDSPYNFFFDVIDDSTFLRATFSSIDVMLQLPSDIFGSPMDWCSYKGLGRAEDDQCDLDLAISTNDIHAEDEDEDEEDDHSVTIWEIGHVPSLIEYQAMDIDRRPDILQQWITDLRDGNSLGDGWYEAEVENKMRHGIPGRLLPTSSASLAQLTREARTVSVAG